MQISYTTASLMFPAISLFMLAYTNRFLAIASLVRNLHDHYKTSKRPTVLAEIKNLRMRLKLIRDMQILGTLSFTLTVLSLIFLFYDLSTWADTAFGISLLCMLLSLLISLIELHFSIGALNIHLNDITDEEQQLKP